MHEVPSVKRATGYHEEPSTLKVFYLAHASFVQETIFDPGVNEIWRNALDINRHAFINQGLLR